MSTSFMIGTLYGEKILQKERPNLKEIKTAGHYWKVTLYFDPDHNQYWEKGAFGRWDTVGYLLLDIKNESDWIPNIKEKE